MGGKMLPNKGDSVVKEAQIENHLVNDEEILITPPQSLLAIQCILLTQEYNGSYGILKNILLSISN